MGSDLFSWDDDSQWESISDPWEPISPPAPQKEQGYLDQWENAWINQPLWTGPSDAARYIANDIDEQTLRNANSGRWDAEIGLNSPYIRGLASGSLQGLGDVMSSFTSPLNLATMGAVKGAGALAKVAPMAGRMLGIGGRALSAPVAAGGAAGVYDELTGDEPIDWTRLGMKTAETAGGILGFHEPIPSGRRPSAPIEAAPPPPNRLQYEAPKTIEQVFPPDVIQGWTPEQRAVVQAQLDAKQPNRLSLDPSMDRSAPAPVPPQEPFRLTMGEPPVPQFSDQSSFRLHSGDAPPSDFRLGMGESPVGPTSDFRLGMGEPTPPVAPPPTPAPVAPSDGLRLGMGEPTPAPTPDAGPMWAAPAAEPTPAASSGNRTVISLKFPEISEVRRLLAQGYVSLPERGPNGEVQMVYQGAGTPPGPTPAGTAAPSRIAGTPEIAGPARPGIQTNPDGSFTVPNQLITEEFMRGVQEDGLDKISQTPTHTTFGTPPTPPPPPGLFQRMLGNRGAVGEVPREGAMTIPSDGGLSTQDRMSLRTPQVMGGEQGAIPDFTSADVNNLYRNQPPELSIKEKIARGLHNAFAPVPESAYARSVAAEYARRRTVLSSPEGSAELDAIAQHGADNVPAEAQRTGLTKRIQDTVNRILQGSRPVGNNEAGMVNTRDILRQLRELAGLGDEVDNVSTRQADADIRELNEATTVEDVAMIRNHWRDRMSMMSDRELQLPEGTHVRDMFNSARQRINELMEVENNARASAGQRPEYTPPMSLISQGTDINAAQNIPELMDIRRYWSNEEIEAGRSNNPTRRRYARDMSNRVSTRMSELMAREAAAGRPISNPLQYRDPVTGRTLAEMYPDPDANTPATPYEFDPANHGAAPETQLDRDLLDIQTSTTIEEARLSRDYWQREVQSTTLPASERNHAADMLLAARARVRELAVAGNDASNYPGGDRNVNPTYEGTPYNPPGTMYRRHLDIENASTSAQAARIRDYWRRQRDGEIPGGSTVLRNRAEELFDDADARYHELLDDEGGGGETAEQMAARATETEARHPNERGYEIVSMEPDGNERVVARVNTENEAADYIVNRSRTNPNGPDLAYRQEGDPGWVPDEQEPLPPSGGNQPFNTPRINDPSDVLGRGRLNRTPAPRPSPTSADIPGRFGVYDYGNRDSRGMPTRIAGFETRAAGEDFMRTHPDRYNLDVETSRVHEGLAASDSANTPITSAPTDHWEAYGPEMFPHDVLRARTGELLPPVRTGIQPPVKGKVRISGEQAMRLRYTAQKGTMDSVYDAIDKIDAWREKESLRRKEGRYGPDEHMPKTIFDQEGWEGFRDQALRNVRTDPSLPGLNIVETYDGAYNLEYRGEDGKAAGFAHVRKHSGVPYGAPDFRYVPELATADSPVGARAFMAIGNALKEMNALDTGHHTISQFTGRAIAGILKKFKSEAGSTVIHHELDPLVTFLNKVASKYMGQAKSNVMDVYADMHKLFSKKKTDLKWLANATWNKYKGSRLGSEKGAVNLGDINKAIRNEEGAIDVGAGINKVWNAVGKATGWGQGESYKTPKGEMNVLAEALAVPSGATTMLDASAPGRQGIGLIGTPEFWGGLMRMPAALHYNTWKKMDTVLRNDPIMVKPRDPVTGKLGKSIGDEIGTKILSPASELGPRGEGTASRWLEMGIGKRVRTAEGNLEWQPTAGSKAWENTAGIPIRATNRMFIHFLNHLNVNRTRKLMDLGRAQAIKGIETGKMPMGGILGGIHLKSGDNIGFKKSVTPDEAMNLNPYHNLVRGKEIADFVNTATGQAPLKIHALPWKKAELSLESAADKLGYAFFSPKLIASRMRMMNPSTYIMASPFVRRQYLKSAIATATAWFTAAQMIKMTAGPEAEVGDDPTSADFGKLRIGDARLDLSGGFSQFAVALSRLYVGGSTSSASGVFHRFGSGYQAQTNEDMMERFFVNKLNPVTKFAWDVASASEYKPFQVGDRTLQLFAPLLAQDMYEIYKEDPSLLPMFGGAAALGGGTQIYGKGEAVSKFLEPENDWTVTGGGVRDVMPWNWGVEPGEERNFPWSEEP